MILPSVYTRETGQKLLNKNSAHYWSKCSVSHTVGHTPRSGGPSHLPLSPSTAIGGYTWPPETVVTSGFVKVTAGGLTPEKEVVYGTLHCRTGAMQLGRGI